MQQQINEYLSFCYVYLFTSEFIWRENMKGVFIVSVKLIDWFCLLFTLFPSIIQRMENQSNVCKRKQDHFEQQNTCTHMHPYVDKMTVRICFVIFRKELTYITNHWLSLKWNFHLINMHANWSKKHIDDWYKHSIKKKISDIDVRQCTCNFNAIPISVRF